MKEKAYNYAHLFLNTKEKENLVLAEKHISNAVDMIDIMRAEMTDNETKVFWRKQTRVIYDVGMELAEWLGDKEKMFYYLEKSKSILLLDELNLKEVRDMIPEDLIEKENALLESYVKSKSESHFYFSKYMSFVDSLADVYPSYYKYKFDTQPPSIRDVQYNLLDESMQLLQYYVTSDSLYTLNITRDDVELITQARPKKLNSRIKTFLKKVNNKDSLEFQKSYSNFLDISNGLYQTLFEKVEKKKPNVIVVGDGLIGYLPFDALVKDIDSEGKPSYLIEDHNFSFASSVSILNKMDKKRESQFNSMLIVCPEDFENEDLQPLVHSKEEVVSLKRLSKNKVLEKSDASFAKFKNESGKFDVIHFSSHSGMDTLSKKPWIAFQDSIVDLNEIYKLNLDASLVTLSSCKSFDGDFQAGEGINSLARAFLFADASAVVGSLWNLNEVSGYEILDDFYKNIRKNQSKPQALRQAKLKYIEENPYKSPFHWASLVCIGNPEKMNIKTNLNVQWIIPVIILLSLFGFRYYQRKSRKVA